MSAQACQYVKKMVRCPSGDTITMPEKSVLWYIADSHNDQEHAAWCSVATLARDNGMSLRRINELIRSLIDKGVLWREPRTRQNSNANSSNLLHFWEIDGPASHDALVAEQVLRLRGERGASIANDAKRSSRLVEFPQNGCEGDCELPQEGTAEVRRGGLRKSAGGDCGSPQGGTAEDRRGGLRKSAPLELLIEPPSDPPAGTLTDPSPEPPAATVVENHHVKHEIARIGECDLARAMVRALESRDPLDQALVRSIVQAKRAR